ncbi:hypothetical protein IV203_037828 [Nitzschia inconspicua]|uniref:Ubiquitin-like protease family profile domain-containing protein n=1 Tax=Nitzschia inconspicua TaxID=303405 RepID=A0A9K3PB93_9STRA|nr:hypothetical protein IV203_024173 [Nitzschia inconspicua]KAG7364626.1 hypothetical protein IV203_037828 [Nitzschia inconspicua]
MSSNLRDDVLIGSSNSFSYFQLMNKKNSGSLDQHEAMSVNSARLQYQHYSRKRYEFISPAVATTISLRSSTFVSFSYFLHSFVLLDSLKVRCLRKTLSTSSEMQYAPCPVQENGHDCALFAFASVLHIVHGHALSAVTFTQQNITQLRDGLNTVLTCNTPDKENDDVFLKLVYKKSENTSPEVQQSKRNPAEGKQADEVLTEVDSAYRPVIDDPQPEAHRDIVSDPSVACSLPGPATNIVEVPRTLDDVFRSMFMDVPTIFEDMSQVDLAMEKY